MAIWLLSLSYSRFQPYTCLHKKGLEAEVEEEEKGWALSAALLQLSE